MQHSICPFLITPLLTCFLTYSLIHSLICFVIHFLGVQAAQMMALKKELAKLKSAQGFKPYQDMPAKKAPDGGVGKGKPPPT